MYFVSYVKCLIKYSLNLYQQIPQSQCIIHKHLFIFKFILKIQKERMKAIKKIQQERELRRIKMEEAKKQKQQKKAYNLASGKNVDIDFELMIEKGKFTTKTISPHQPAGQVKLAVSVRKRPIFKKQQVNGQIDAISAANPQIKIHQPKYKVDGITKYVQNHTFTFDNTFNEQQTTDDIYKSTLKPLLPNLLKSAIVTCFAYGQTGSGKTYTMNGLQKFTVQQLFELTKKNYNVTVSFFQIYGGRCLDLLNQKSVLNILEDKSGTIQIPGLIQKAVQNAKQLLVIMDQANNSRTTYATVANDTSSRSHAICQVLIRRGNQQNGGKLVLVDLAGSQRAQDTQSNNRQRRLEGAQINKSLLALKQCIRAMDDKADHVPFRASKLTLILRDSFVDKSNTARVVMIACVSPGSSSSDHSLNTLRYADRLKDQTQLSKKCDQIMQQNKSLQAKKQMSKQNIQKIDSAKMIKKQEPQKQPNNSNVNRNSNQPKNQSKNVPKNSSKSHNSINNNISEKTSNTQNTNKPSILNPPQTSAKKLEPPVKQNGRQKEKNRSNSYKKPIVATNNTKNITNNSNPALNKQKQVGNHNKKDNSYDENVIDEEIQIQDKAKMENKKKVKDDLNAMKRTMRNQKNEEFFDFQEKVSNILEEQEQVFATHMAAIKEDAKLLTLESQLISKIQGVGFMDYDVDSYVDKLESIIKKKMKMYTLLTKKVENFKKYLKEEDQVRHKVKQTFYY